MLKYEGPAEGTLPRRGRADDLAACSQEPHVTGCVERARDEKTPCFHPFICVDPKYDQPQNKFFISPTIPVHTMMLKELLIRPAS